MHPQIGFVSQFFLPRASAPAGGYRHRSGIGFVSQSPARLAVLSSPIPLPTIPLPTIPLPTFFSFPELASFCRIVFAQRGAGVPPADLRTGIGFVSQSPARLAVLSSPIPLPTIPLPTFLPLPGIGFVLQNCVRPTWGRRPACRPENRNWLRFAESVLASQFSLFPFPCPLFPCQSSTSDLGWPELPSFCIFPPRSFLPAGGFRPARNWLRFAASPPNLSRTCVLPDAAASASSAGPATEKARPDGARGPPASGPSLRPPKRLRVGKAPWGPRGRPCGRTPLPPRRRPFVRVPKRAHERDYAAVRMRPYLSYP